jgi:uncharacterized repeat protein (TIGR01451 family)
MRSTSESLALVGTLVLAFGLDSALGILPSNQPDLPNFDKRAGAGGGGDSMDHGQKAALGRLQARIPDVKVTWDQVAGTPKWIASSGGFLTGPNGQGQGVTAGTAALPAEEPHRAVKAFLNEHAALFGHDAGVLAGAQVKRDYRTEHNGLRTVVWQQQLEGKPVFGAVLIAHTARNGALVNLSSQFVPDLAGAAAKSVPNRLALLKGPPISARQAIVNAALVVNEQLALDKVVALPQRGDEREGVQRHAAAPTLKGETEAQLVWLPMNRSTLRLCWEVILTSGTRGEMFRVLIDAENGEALLRQSLTTYISNATYRVYLSDSPSPFSPGHPTPLTNQPPLVPRVLMVTNAANTNASPNGWMNDGVNETVGNNVDAHLDRNADDIADLPRPQGSPFRVFDFSLDLTQSPATYGDAATVQLFYWCNWMHDKLYELGFTEAAGNFQTDNFGRGGLGNDAVQADAQDGSGVNNANFSTPPDGTAGRMQMYVFDGPIPNRDGDLDAEIVLHEYTHGLSNRRVGGGVGISQLQTAGMGEGWSDFYALALLSEAGDDVDGNYAAGGYATFRLGGLMENYYYGIRRYPYSTVLTNNPLTFKDIDPDQADEHAGIPRSPIIGSQASEVHNQGEVWCVTLWEVRANLVRQHGYEAGNRLALQLVTDGMNLSPPNPNFLEARDAILQADILDNGGTNYHSLWAGFAKRGMGYSATSPSSDTTAGVHEAFDMPDDLVVTPLTDFSAVGPEGGPFSPGSQSYSLMNLGTNVVNWQASVAANWVALSTNAGTLPPGGAAVLVEASIDPATTVLPAGLYRNSITFSNHATGSRQIRQVTLSVGQSDYFTELFAQGDVRSLGNQTITFTPDGSRSFYSACRQSAATFPTDPNGGNSLYPGDDGFAQVTLSGGRRVSIYETNSDVFYVGSNGYITLGEGDSSLFASLANHFRLPRISALLDDLDPSSGGTISWKQLNNRVAVTFLNVPEYGMGNINSFQIEMFFDGMIRLTYLRIDAASGLIGLSAGGGVPVDFRPSDFGSYLTCGLPRLTITLPADAREADGVVTNGGRVSLASPAAAELTVQLVSSDTSVLLVPAQVIIPAGATNATFDLTIVDDAVLDGTRRARVTASAPGYPDASASLLVFDRETATLAVSLPATVTEGEGIVWGVVSISAAPAVNVLVNLASSDPNEIEVPLFVIIPAGQTSSPVAVAVVDDGMIDGPQVATITAHVANWTDGAATVTVLDNENTTLVVALRREANESAGVITNGGLVRISGTLPTNLVVALASSDATRLAVPVTATILAGTTSAPISLTLLDNQAVDGPEVVTVSATADTWGPGSATITVYDDETPPFPSLPFPSHLATNQPLNLTLSWSAGLGEQVVNGRFETGNFTGWSKKITGTADFVINDGTYTPPSGDGPWPPFAGKFSALAEQTGPSKSVLYQDVAIPAGAASVVLSWAERIRNHASVFANDQFFRVEIRATDDSLREILFSTQPGDPLLNNWVTRRFDLSAYSGEQIRLAFVVQSALYYLDVHLDNLSLQLGPERPTLFEVYFGTNSSPGLAEFQGSTTNSFWAIPPLPLDTACFWKVVARRGAAESAGPVWQFTTRGIGPLHHFGWANIPTPQLVGVPFAVAITAQDDIDNTVTNFTGAVRLGGWLGDSAGPIEDFESGIWPTPPWVGGSGGTVSPSHAHDGNYGLSDPEWVHRTDVQIGAPGESLSWWIRLDSASNARAYLGFAASDAGCWSIVAAPNTSAFILQQNPGYDYLELVTVSQTWEAGKWYKVAVAFLPSASVTCNLYDSDGTTLLNSLSYTNVTGLPGGIAMRSFGGYSLDTISGGAQPVPVSPTNSGTFVNGLWSGDLTVLQPAASMVLSAIDTNGHFGQGNGFAVYLQNDLMLGAAASPDPVSIGADLTYLAVVSNSGPATATGVILTATLPASVSFVSAASSQGACTVAGRVVTGDLGSLAGGSNAAVSIVVRPTALGTLSSRFVVARGEADPDPTNNTATVVTSVRTPALAISDTAVLEGDAGTTNALFTVLLSPGSTNWVSVRFASANGSATAGADYVATDGLLIFAPGVTSQTVQVPVLGDTLYELDETFLVNLSSPTNAVLASSQGVGTILNDDPVPALSIGDASVVEGNVGTVDAVFAVNLSGASGQTVTVNYYTSDGTATAGSDYLATSGLLTFSPGQTSQTIVVKVVGDTVTEPNEIFHVDLDGAGGAVIENGEGTGTILNDDGLPGQVDHFVWAALPSAQYLNEPFGVTVTAQDAFNATVTTFTNTVELSGRQGGGAGTNMILGNVVHTQLGSGGTWTDGYAFTPNTNLTVTHVRHYGGDKVSIWTDAGTLLGSQVVSSSPGTWLETPLVTPVQLLAGNRYRLALLTAGGNYYWRTDGPSTFADGTIDASYEVSGDGFPSNSDSARWWLVDLRYTVGTTMPVSITPVTSGSFVSGVWSGNLTVQEAATNLVLVADDRDGHTGSSSPFSAFYQNDLAVDIADGPDPVAVGGIVTYTIVVTNSGPLEATGVRATNTLPGSATFVSANSSQGTCTNSGGTITCTLGTLPGGTGATVTIVATVSVAGQITDRVSVGRAEADAYLPNNSAAAVTAVRVPSLSISDVSVFEGDNGTTEAVFAVQLFPPAINPVSVHFATANGSASAGTDYVATNGVLLFAPGETNQPITVLVKGDTLYEPDEDFRVTLSAPVNAVVGDSQAVGTILNDDPYPTLSIGDTSVVEGNAGTSDAVFVVSLSNPSSEIVTVYSYTSDGTATAGSDYLGTNDFLSFAPGQTNLTLRVKVFGDTANESDETFSVYLYNNSGANLGDSAGLGTILNDDFLPTLAAAGTSLATESCSDGALSPNETVTVNFALRNISGGAARTTNLVATLLTTGGVATPSEPQQYGSVLPGGPAVAMPFSFTVAAVCGGTVTATLRLQDGPNDLGTLSFPLQVGLPNLVFAESFDELAAPGLPPGWTVAWTGDGAAWVTTSNSSDTPPNSVFAPDPYSSSDNQLTSPPMLLPGAATQLSFRHSYGTESCCDRGLLEISIAGGGFNDILSAGGSFVTNGYTGSGVTNATGFGWSGYSGGFITTVVNLPAAAAGKTSQLRWHFTSDGSVGGSGWYVDSISISSGFVCCMPNDLSVTVQPTPEPVSIGETLTYLVVVSNTGPASATGVRLTNTLPAGVTFVSANASQGICTPVGQIVACDLGTVTAGSNVFVAIEVIPTALGTLTNRVTVTRAEADPNLANNTALAISSVLNPALYIDDVAVQEGNGGLTNAVFTVLLSPGSTNTVSVRFATANGGATAVSDYVATNGLLVFAPGQTSQRITVLVKGDTVYETNETFLVNLFSPTNATLGDSQGVGTILNDDPPPTVSLGDVSVTEGSVGAANAAVPVTLSAPSGLPVTVSYYTSDGSAVAGSDYLATNGVVTFTAGQTNRTILVKVLGDTLIEPDESFYVYLSGATDATIGLGQGRGTILNDDGLPGRVDHFVWDVIFSPQYVNQPFAVTVTAQDLFNATVTDFTSSVALTGNQGGGARTNTILGDVAYSDALSGTYTVGYAFRPATNLLVTHVRHYAGTKVSIWTDSGTLLASQNVSSLPGTWTETPLSTPVQLLAGNRYRLGFYTAGGSFYARTDLPATFTDGVIEQAYYTTADGFPDLYDGWRWVLVDLRYTVGTSKPVPITPAISGDFVAGVWSGPITVQQLATNMMLVADDRDGHSGSSERFSAFYQNDLAVDLADAPDPVAVRSPLTYTIVVTNTGPLEATGVTVTNLLPVAATFVSATSSQGTCANSGGTVTCDLGTIPGGSNATVTIVATAGGVGQMTNRVNLGRGEADAYQANNSAVAVTAVVQPSLSINDVSVLEGDSGTTGADFVVSLAPPSATNVWVRFAMVSGGAGAGLDFVATNGLLTFAPGETSQTITVLVKGDTLYETNETFLVNLGSPTNAVLGKGQGVGTILNDDPLPIVSISDARVTEGNVGTANAAFVVSLSAPSGLPVTINYYTQDGAATAGDDYIPTNGVLTLTPGQTNRTIPVKVIGDTVVEPDETFYVYLFGATDAEIGVGQGIGTIVNDDGLPGQVDHFAWEAVPSPQYLNQPFGVTVTAQDAFNAPVSDFTNTVALSAGQSGGARTNMILGNLNFVNSSSGDWTLGYAFTPSTNLTVTHVRHYSGTKVSIWTDSGTLLASQPVSSSPGAWRETPLATPLQLLAGNRYRVAFYAANGAYYWRDDGAPTFADGTIDLGYERSGDGFPSNPDSVRWWFVDLRYTVGTTKPVSITPAISGNFVNGVWSGNLTVRSLGTNLVLAADDRSGHRGASAPFEVSLAGDVSLAVSASPEVAHTNSPLTYTLTVYNPGPTAATGVLVSNLLPPAVSFLSATPSQGSCTLSGNTVRCELGSLDVRRSAVVQILVSTPSIFGNLTNRATLFVNELDPNPTNNAVTTVTSVPDFPPVVSLISPQDGLVFTYPALLTLEALASDEDGFVTKVEFFNNGNKLGEATSSPFTFDWASAAPGTDVLTAKATDNGGKVATSDPVTITVVPPPPGDGIGLYGEYFNNMDLTGPGVTRIDPTVSFYWYTGSPDPAIDYDTFSARWTGSVQPFYSDLYTFTTYSDDGVRLWVDGQQIINNWTSHTGTSDSGTIALEAGRLYQLRLEYFDNTVDAIITLSWSSTNQFLEIIPQSQLYPLPVITSQPVSRNAAPGANVTLSVAALGQPPLTYQWRWNGTNLPGATAASLPLTNVQLSSSGEYSVEVNNVYGAVTSRPAVLNVGSAPVLAADPQSRLVLSGSNVTLSVSAAGSLPLSYRWRKGGTTLTNLILNESNCVYEVRNAQTTDAANYTVVITNVFGPANRVVSSNAALSVVNSRSTQVVTNQGSNVTFSLAAASPGPLSYQWYFNLTTPLVRATNASLLLTNVQGSNAGQYHVVVTNSAGSVTAQVASLSVILPDTDHDGMPDEWELAHGLNPLDPTDAKADPDHDGMSNLDEWIAGTDPQDPLSVLKAALVGGGMGGALISFTAMPNISYTLQYRTDLVEGEWLKLRDVAAQPALRTVEILDPDATPGAKRYYRIATPQQP